MAGGLRSQRKAAVHKFSFRALVTLDSWDKACPPWLDPSRTHDLMVHASHPSGPPGGKYLPAEITRDDGKPLRSGESQIVTITVTDDDAPLLLAPGEPFRLWGGASGSGIVSRRVFTASGPS